jgi:hypothetical protein
MKQQKEKQLARYKKLSGAEQNPLRFAQQSGCGVATVRQPFMGYVKY